MAPARPWTAHYEPGVPAGLPAAREPFQRFLETAAAGAPGTPAVLYFNRAWSYAELNTRADRVAGALRRDGLRPGERVLLAMVNGPRLACAFFGVLKAGGVAVVVDPTLADASLAGVLAAAEPAQAIAAPEAAARLAGGAPGLRVVVSSPRHELPLLVRLVSARGRFGPGRGPRPLPGWSAWLRGVATFPEVDLAPEAPAAWLRAADLPGGWVCFRHRHLVAGAQALRLWLQDAAPGEDSWLLLAPLWTAFGLVAGLGTAIGLRSRLVLLPGAEAADGLAALRYLRPSYVVAGRAAMERLVEDPRLARRELRSVRAWIAPELLDPGLAQAFAEITALEPCAGFAPDGVAGLATCNPVNGRRLAGSVGLPLPGVSLAVVDAAGRACRPGEPGRLELAGPSVATPGGVLQTDRPVWQDEAGYVHFLEASVPASGRADWHNGATRPATA